VTIGMEYRMMIWERTGMFCLNRLDWDERIILKKGM
jgi:hypothetical protein